ncbi:MAG: S8 family serine peptidase [Microbacterium sp.]|uniref:S8 family peptidase n=1 Tax=Microbacterium sp. TaxID=51671 RepID=UPI0039E2F801
MSHPHAYRRTLAVAAALALSVPATAAFAASSDDDPAARFQKAQSSGPVGTAAKPLSIDSNGRVTVIVEMKGDPVAVVEAEEGRELSDGERSTIKSRLKKKQDAIAGSITSKGGKIEAKMQSAYNGLQIDISAKQVDAVADLPNVVAIHPVKRYDIENAVSVPFLGVPSVWESTKYTGKRVKVAIIDTGVDYTHANFAGPGTTEAFEQAAATSASSANPAWFGPSAPRVKGGWDFVGDDYDASETETATPQPDPNPLDCNGHGSHVAGTAAGSGVTDAGQTYTGPYNKATADKDWTIGPGVAPQADLYALRVFGCDGSSEVVVPAIDWAVDHRMDVINMSLGSDFGRGEDPDAVAASNAVGAGVVVVAAAGNSGPSPYIVGSPGAGDGVISVAAVDSSESFPGAEITVGGQAIPAINANGASLDGLGELPVVYLSDDPETTEEDESTGCSVEAYEHAGVAAGSNQLAVATRGVCARVAKAIFAQQAGAAAAVMVNTSEDYPPYEGTILSNPDTGEEYEVTIPFLGVPLSVGETLEAAVGENATIAAAELQNPGFRNYASFSSNGPRSGDSALGVDVAAPGVSIVSTGVGTGAGSETLSGTSMATPHVAGVAALAVQAHPKWSAGQVAAAVVSTADPDKVSGQSTTRGGVGLVDAKQAVGTKVTATGDAFRTDSGWLRETALSLGFQESSLAFSGVKTITVRNDGKKTVTYRVSSTPSAQSLKAKVVLSKKSVTVKPGKSAKIVVAVGARASVVPSSIGDDEFAFHEFSGDVVLTAKGSTLRVPYLMVPRSTTRVSSASAAPWFASSLKVKSGAKSFTLTNPLGAYAAAADVYTWGLSDGRDADKALVDTGYDLRAAGVQSFESDGDQLLVFAVNNHKRWSSAAQDEFDVLVDTDDDGEPDFIVFSADSGAVRAGAFDGTTEVFVYDVAGQQLYASGFAPQAPTDSSTILIPVWASDLGLTADAGAFDYTVESYSYVNLGDDAFSAWAAYDPWAPALSNGQYESVPRNGSVTVSVDVDAAAFQAQQPLGAMAVVLDNAAGSHEAVLVRAR